jgi:hypothetical protein
VRALHSVVRLGMLDWLTDPACAFRELPASPHVRSSRTATSCENVRCANLRIIRRTELTSHSSGVHNRGSPGRLGQGPRC